MAESIGTRVGRIIAGSVHALVDTVENAAPEMVMEQAIREVDEVIDDVRAELGRAAANKHLASTRLMEENRKHEELGAQIELAVGQARDDLASAAIARQLDIEAQIPVLETTIADCQGREKELEGYIAALQAKKREMQEAVRQFVGLARAGAGARGAAAGRQFGHGAGRAGGVGVRSRAAEAGGRVGLEPGARPGYGQQARRAERHGAQQPDPGAPCSGQGQGLQVA